MGTTIDAAGWPRRGEEGPAVVALGGGHGLSATLRALRHVTHRLTAVVTVADDGSVELPVSDGGLSVYAPESARPILDSAEQHLLRQR